jgi:hypothetical protein
VEQYITVNLNATRNGIRRLPPERRRAEARRYVKMSLVPADASEIIADQMIPDSLVSESMIDRYLEITPPVMAVIPEFQEIVEEIERSYVRGGLFSALSAACVSLERLLNLARMKLHRHHHPKIKALWNKVASDQWAGNIDALNQWGYLDRDFASELNDVYKDIRCKYLHSGPICNVREDCLRSVNAAYRLVSIFLGLSEDLFRSTGGIECKNASDPRFIEFYAQKLVPPNDSVS